ncbi:MAG: ATP-dependent DNA helicase [Pseudomonadales bacterium]
MNGRGSNVHRISVGELSRFWQRGDINFRFTGRSSAIEGIRGHQYVQKKRGEDYISEKTVSLTIERSGFVLEILGRVDGYLPNANPVTVEEIKTLRMSPDDLPESVKEIHLAQLKIYGFILSELENIDSLSLRLCYFDLDEKSEHWIEDQHSAEDLKIFFRTTIDRYLKWLDLKQKWQQLRDQSIESSAFPYGKYRDGQRDMAVATYRSIVDGEQLVLQAPTGIGKTMATIFPAMKAMRAAAYDKLFYLSAKTSGQRMAEDSIAVINDSGVRFKSLTITAKDKVCFNPGSPCDPDHCEFSRGYYDRLEAGTSAALDAGDQLDRHAIEVIAKTHTLCPFEFSLDLARSVDLIICDYNYVFDPVVYLRRFFDDNGGKYSLLIDEAHNLVDRGRDMYSATLIKDDFLALRRKLKSQSPILARMLARVNAVILSMRGDQKDELESQNFLVLPEVPARFITSLKNFCEHAEILLKDKGTSAYQEDLLKLYFDCLRFNRTAEQADENYAVLLIKEGKHTFVKLFCIDPATRLAEGFSRMASSVCFSATMKPQDYFQRLLGLDAEARWYQLRSPFNAQRQGVFVVPYISTNYRERDGSIDDLVQVIDKVVNNKPGNYLIFFPSHAYLQSVYQKFKAGSPQVKTIVQDRYMAEDDRTAFLNSFQEGSEITGFAVMGGVFSEGVDLKGKRLIGVVIAGVGLPQIGIERDLIRNYWSDDGFEFAYQFPGMNKVLQTAGRVIRDVEDRGIICLVDRRFAENRYKRLFPEEWQIRKVNSPEELEAKLDAFWQVESV